MAKQIHINLDDAVYEALTEYSVENNFTMQDSVSTAVMQLVNRQKNIYDHTAPFTFIDLFAGIGGMRLAFESVGGHCVYSNEWNKYSQQTYFANFGEQPDGDITKVDENSIPDHDVLVAGFPCQPFSIAGVSKKNSLGRATGFQDKHREHFSSMCVAFLRPKGQKLLCWKMSKTLRAMTRAEHLKSLWNR